MKNQLLVLALVLSAILVISANGQIPGQRRQMDSNNITDGSAKPEDSQRSVSNSDKRARFGGLTEIVDQLELDDDQRIEVLATIREFASEMKMQMAEGKSGTANATMDKERREEILSRLRSQGLEGKALKQAAMQELGVTERLKAGNRPKDMLVQKQAELIAKVREILTDSQRAKLDELLRANAKDAAAKAAEDPTPSNNPKKRQRPGKGG